MIHKEYEAVLRGDKSTLDLSPEARAVWRAEMRRPGLFARPKAKAMFCFRVLIMRLRSK